LSDSHAEGRYCSFAFLERYYDLFFGITEIPMIGQGRKERFQDGDLGIENTRLV